MRRAARLPTILVVIALSACATAPSRPVAAPDTDRLQAFLDGSPSAREIRAAAAGEDLLSVGARGLEDLRLTLQALGIASVDGLEARVEAALAHVRPLFAAVARRRAGSRVGDVAHWVAVALLALDARSPDESILRRESTWEADYLALVLELRQAGEAGRLAEAALPDGPDEVRTTEFLVPEFAVEYRPIVEARRSTSFWPVFQHPGARTVSATIALERGATLEWDAVQVRLGGAGKVRVVDGPVVVERLERNEDGTLVTAGSVSVPDGEVLDLVLAVPGRGEYARTGDGALVMLPFGCCNIEADSDEEWWVRVSAAGEATGWILASARGFRLRFPELEERWRRMRESWGTAARLGDLAHGGTLEVEGGARLVYWVAGNPAGEPLFVLHGGPGLGSAYLRPSLTELLGPTRKLVFYDQRGSGYSEGRDDATRLTIDWSVSDLDALRRAARVERIDLLGHSFGGLLAMHYALEHPDRVRRLILVDPDPASRELWETFRDRLGERTDAEDAARLAEITATADWQADPEMMSEWYATRLRAYVADPSSADELDVRFDDMTLANFWTTYPAVRASLGDWDLHDRLGGIEAPTLIVAGGDSIFDPEAISRLAESLPAARLETLSATGHFPFIEAPRAFARLVEAFLDR